MKYMGSKARIILMAIAYMVGGLALEGYFGFTSPAFFAFYGFIFGAVCCAIKINKLNED